MSATTTANGHVNRTQRYNWRTLSNKGRLEWLDKFLLNIDHEYQRSNVTNSRVLAIAKDWDWRACGTISVAKRPDGTNWVFDGQHRVLGARKRDDVIELPCWVFDIANVSDEAEGYVIANNVRGPMKAIERFKARIVANDVVALQVAELVERVGYRIAAGDVEFCLSCVQAVEDMLVKDRETAELVMEFCAELYKGRPIHNCVMKGLAHLNHVLKRAGDRITRPDIRKKLLIAGPDAIQRSINEARGFFGKGGDRVFAEGLVRLINKGKSTNRIQSMIG